MQLVPDDVVNWLASPSPLVNNGLTKITKRRRQPWRNVKRKG